jgi:phosphotransferase system, enzyme I, PtsP
MDQGFVGMALENLKPVKEGPAGRHPILKNFNEARENSFDSILAVPVHRGDEKIGVLMVQHQQRDYFAEIDVMAMRAIASQLAGAVGNARLLMGHSGQASDKQDANRLLETAGPLKGRVASYGDAFAPATVFNTSHGRLVAAEMDTISEYTLKDFHRAVQNTTNQIQELQSRFEQRLAEGTSLIFTAHLMILKDKRFAREMAKQIKNGIPVPAAVKTVAKHYIELFESSPFEHVKDKANDVKDLAGRILNNLDRSSQDAGLLSENRIVIAPELCPSDVLRLASENIKGIILVGGGVTSHVAIIARSLQIPMIIVNRPELLDLPEGTPIILDAESAREQNTEISVCGELAHDPNYIPFLLGIGIRSLSVDPSFLPAVQKAIKGIRISDAKIYAKRLLTEDFLQGSAEVQLQFKDKFGYNKAGG